MRKYLALIGVCCVLARLVWAVPAGSFDWNGAETLSPGILHTAVTVTEPRQMAIHAVQVDVTEPRLRFYATPADPAKGQPMPEYPKYTITTRRQPVRKYIEQARQPVANGGYGLDMVLAVNAAPWTPWEEPFTHPYAEKLGLAISQGKLVAANDNPVPVFAIRRDGTPDIRVVIPGDNTDDLDIALTGFSQVLIDGEVLGDDHLDPRTLFGISADRQYIYFVTVDGRQEGYSLGIGTGEAAEWMKYFGAMDAMNMDGGGSTQLAVYVPSDNTVKLLNHPPKNAERGVANCLGVYYLPREQGVTGAGASE